MSKPWMPHVVEQGDHLEKLAFLRGVSADDVWSNPKNKEIVALRKNRDTLCPGDVVFLPSDPKPSLPLQAGTNNRYRARVPKVSVHLHLNLKGRAVANKAFEVHGIGGNAPLTGTTTADGQIAFEVPIWVREALVKVPELGLAIPVLVGDLDPIEENSGVAHRLRNLGYLPAALTDEVDEQTLAQAVRAFQRDQKLKLTGAVDDETRSALQKEHLV